MAIEFIRPKDLPAAAGVDPNDDMIVDSGAAVGRATPREIVDAARPVATEPQAVAGTDNDVAMTPLTTSQAIAADGAGIKSDAQAALQGAQTAQGLAEGARDSAQGYASAAGGFASDAAGSASGASSSASAALVSEGNAASSESAASQAASSAVTAQGLAEDWAESPTAPGDPGTKSSKTWAGEAAQSATEAATFDPALYLTKADKATTSEAQEGTRDDLYVTPKGTSDARDATALGWGQEWVSVTRTTGTIYTNNTGRPIQVSFFANGESKFQVRSNPSDPWVTASQYAEISSAGRHFGDIIVPDGADYRFFEGLDVLFCAELR